MVDGHATDSLVAITLQARAGLRRLSRSPERAGEALREIEALAPRALEETRTAVATIRSGTDGTALRPQPTLADLVHLVESMRGSDLGVHLVVDPAARELAPYLQAAAYRIVQESLSNAAKHARPARTEVRITHAEAVLTVEITDDSWGDYEVQLGTKAPLAEAQRCGPPLAATRGTGRCWSGVAGGPSLGRVSTRAWGTAGA